MRCATPCASSRRRRSTASSLERPPTLALGDLACPVAFDLAKPLKKAPRAIAAELAGAVRLPPGVREVRVEGGGYLNFFSTAAVRPRAARRAPAPAPARDGKIIVEHTNINPNKAAHIGHLRNAVLGDVLVRSLRHLGHAVEVQNYLDDTGVQVADVVAGLVHLEGVGTLEAARARDPRERAFRAGAANPKGFAYLCWDLYAEVGRTYAARPETQAWRAEVAPRDRGGRQRDGAHRRRRRPRPSPRRTSRRWAGSASPTTCSRARATSSTSTSGRAPSSCSRTPARCTSRPRASTPAAGCCASPESEEFAGMEEPDKILVRSNGTVTYTGKDIAYQLWKFGLLGVDFDYERFRARLELGRRAAPRRSRRPCARIRSGGPPTRAAIRRRRPSAAATRVYNVIDVRQSYPQKVVREGLRALGLRGRGGPLDPLLLRDRRALAEGGARARRALRRGIPALAGGREEALRRDVGAQGSGRQGRRPRRAPARALAGRDRAAPRRRGPGRGGAQAADRDARAIAVGALRYFLLKVGRNKVIAFDFDEAAELRGRHGAVPPVLARPRRQHLPQARGEGPAGRAVARRARRRGMGGRPLGDRSSTPRRPRDVAERAIESLELVDARAARLRPRAGLQPLLPPPSDRRGAERDVRNRRLAIARIFRREMARLLELLGIPEPGRM